MELDCWFCHQLSFVTYSVPGSYRENREPLSVPTFYFTSALRSLQALTFHILRSFSALTYHSKVTFNLNILSSKISPSSVLSTISFTCHFGAHVLSVPNKASPSQAMFPTKPLAAHMRMFILFHIRNSPQSSGTLKKMPRVH